MLTTKTIRNSELAFVKGSSALSNAGISGLENLYSTMHLKRGHPLFLLTVNVSCEFLTNTGPVPFFFF